MLGKAGSAVESSIRPIDCPFPHASFQEIQRWEEQPPGIAAHSKVFAQLDREPSDTASQSSANAVCPNAGIPPATVVPPPSPMGPKFKNSNNLPWEYPESPTDNPLLHVGLTEWVNDLGTKLMQGMAFEYSWLARLEHAQELNLDDVNASPEDRAAHYADATLNMQGNIGARVDSVSVFYWLHDLAKLDREIKDEFEGSQAVHKADGESDESADSDDDLRQLRLQHWHDLQMLVVAGDLSADVSNG